MLTDFADGHGRRCSRFVQVGQERGARGRRCGERGRKSQCASGGVFPARLATSADIVVRYKSSNFKLASPSRTSWEVSAYYGLVSSNLDFSARARMLYGQTYETPAEAEICRTVSVPVGQECISGPDGLPLRKRTGLFSIETRHLFPLSATSNVAAAPQVTYRFEDNNIGVEVPVYLSPHTDGKLSGGLKFAYNSKGDEFGIGMFVGVPFSIFFN